MDEERERRLRDDAEPADRDRRDAAAGTGPEVSGEDAAFERAMEIGGEVMRDHRAVLAALAE